MCEVAFRMVYGLRYNRFSSIKLKYSTGAIFAQHGRIGKGRHSDSSIRAISWLRMFFDKVGDRLPMKEDVHLPSCLTKADVYTLAADDLSQGDLQCCGVSTFYKIWKTEFPHVKIPKVSEIRPLVIVSHTSATHTCAMHMYFHVYMYDVIAITHAVLYIFTFVCHTH